MKIIFLAFLALAMLFAAAPIAYAHCPLCTAAVGAAAVSAKYYGMDMSIIGLMIGAFGISTGLWIGLKVKKQFFMLQLPVIVILSFLLTVIPLLALNEDYVYFPLLLFGSAGTLLNKVYWVNKLLLGSVIGGAVTLTAYYLHLYIKRTRGKVLFPFQGVAFTIASLGIASLGLYLIF